MCKELYDFEYLTNTEGIELQDVFYEFERKAVHKELPKFKEIWRGFNKQLRKFEKIK